MWWRVTSLAFALWLASVSSVVAQQRNDPADRSNFPN
jgi:hypothetical protein